MCAPRFLYHVYLKTNTDTLRCTGALLSNLFITAELLHWLYPSTPSSICAFVQYQHTQTGAGWTMPEMSSYVSLRRVPVPDTGPLPDCSPYKNLQTGLEWTAACMSCIFFCKHWRFAMRLSRRWASSTEERKTGYSITLLLLFTYLLTECVDANFTRECYAAC